MDADPVKSDATLRHTTMVSLAMVLRVACVAPKLVRWSSPFCIGRSRDFFPLRLVRRLSDYLADTGADGDGDRMAALSALNILGHEALIDVVAPLIDGSRWTNPALRSKAVLTLHKLAHAGHPRAVHILHLVYANPSDNYQVRHYSLQQMLL